MLSRLDLLTWAFPEVRLNVASLTIVETTHMNSVQSKAKRNTMHMGEIQAHYNVEDSQSIMSVICRVWSIIKPNITRTNLIPGEFSDTSRNTYTTKKEIKFAFFLFLLYFQHKFEIQYFKILCTF